MHFPTWAERLTSTTEQTAMFVAAAGVRGTFEPSLVPRSLLDQALVTGLSTTVSYALTANTQDVLRSLAAVVAERGRIPSARATLWLDLAAVPIGLVTARAIARHPHESVSRGFARQVAWRTAVTGAGAATVTVARAGLGRLDGRVGGRGWLAGVPLALPVGLVVGYAVEAAHRRGLPEEPVISEDQGLNAVGARAAGLAVAVGLAGAALAERLVADGIGALAAQVLPGGRVVWRPVGHGLTLAALAGAGTMLFHRAISAIEAGTTAIEPLLEQDGGQRLVGPTASGSTESLVPWNTLGREGRRHVLFYPRPESFAARPPGVPDLSIATVMQEPAVAAPAMVFVGLDSAPTAKERVDLALAELDRVHAFDRQVLMLISPTGTGYVNYCATSAVSYLTRGDVAFVTMQYSKRPSPLSLLKVKDAREQNRLLWLGISARLRNRSGRRPRVVLFGESLGAHTSQDVLLHWGTLGPQAMGIDRALWIGTPYGSGWMHQVTGPARPDVDPALVAVVNDFGQIQAMSPQRRAGLRYVLVSHDNDGVTKFGPDIFVNRPGWLGPDRPRPEIVPDASPRGIPARLRWRPVTSFLQTLMDMKNAQKMQGYRAWAHDYRPDIARFVSEVYGLPASADQMARIEAALRQREEAREHLLAEQTAQEKAAGRAAAQHPAG